MADSTILRRKSVAWGAHTVSPALAPSSYRILKLAVRDTAVSVFVGCMIPSWHRFRKKTVTRLCKNGPIVSARIPCFKYCEGHGCFRKCFQAKGSSVAHSPYLYT